MSGLNLGGFAHSPRSKTRPAQDGASTRDEVGVQLSLKSVSGSTTSSSNGFDTLSDHRVFAYCAGPAAVLSYVDEHYNISQRLFRAKPGALPVNSGSSFYNPSTPPTTPSKVRLNSSLRDGSSATGPNTLTSYTQEFAGTSKLASWNREATCLSLSKNGKLVAVGETGYNPRVLIFSTTPDSPSDSPLSIVTDHSFGVQSVAFSKDSRWLCSLGNTHDAFLLLYSVNTKTAAVKLHASNKCSNVSKIAWMGGNVITIGSRHVKVWRVDQDQPASSLKGRPDLDNMASLVRGSAGPKTFSGRNSILGSLLNANFTCVAAISDSRAILCTNQGDVCLLDDSDGSQTIKPVIRVDFGVESAYFDERRDVIWLVGRRKNLQALEVKSLVSASGSPNISVSLDLLTNPEIETLSAPSLLAVGTVGSDVVDLDSERQFSVRRIERLGSKYILGEQCKHLPAHEKPALGVCESPANSIGDLFLTYSADGVILFCSSSGACSRRIKIPLNEPLLSEPESDNELKVLKMNDAIDCFIAGDKRGYLRICRQDGTTEKAVKAHNSDINGLAIAKESGQVLVASCGRDRAIQVFLYEQEELRLQQTVDDHAASVIDVSFADQGSSLLSISSDRTIIIRRMARDAEGAMAFLASRAIPLKASPACFNLVACETNNLMVSTVDRQVHRYDYRSGRLLNSFRATDPSSGENVLITSLSTQQWGDGPDSRTLLFGVSAADKALRIHDCGNGRLIFRDQGQSTMSAIGVISETRPEAEGNRTLVSCGLDGTVLVWSISPTRQGVESPSRADFPLKQTPQSSSAPRKTLTKADINKFQRSLESDDGSISPVRSPSPSRIRKKSSRPSLIENRRTSLASITNINVVARSSGINSELPPDRSPATTGNAKLNSKQRRPSLDSRRRSKSAANLNDLNDSARKTCQFVRDLRERVEASASGKMDPKTVLDLEKELSLLLRAISEEAEQQTQQSAQNSHESLDTYLARIIDGRLALRTQLNTAGQGDNPNATNSRLSKASPAGGGRIWAQRSLETLAET